MSEVKFSVPLAPPSVNAYVRHTRGGGHYLTKEALAFKDAIALFARRQQIRGDAYEVDLTVYQAKGGRTDADNMSKLVLDGLQRCGAIDTDSKVTDLHIHKRRDWDKPRTEIKISLALDSKQPKGA